MTQNTAHLSLPLLAASQAQKHVTHNEALVLLDALVQLSVLDNNRTAAPTAPASSDRFLVADQPTGVWAGRSGQIALWDNGDWTFLVPKAGWQVWVKSEQRALVHDGLDWRDLKVRTSDQFGINATADSVNRLSVTSQAVLLNHDGAGHQLKINKAAAANAAAIVLQTGFSGRAEMGLTGDDDFRIKTSPDGASWRVALQIKRATGEVSFPNGVFDVITGLRPMMLLPAPIKEIWRSDLDATATPRSYSISAVSGANITLTTNSVEQIFNVTMLNSAMVRVWNISKTPPRPAWVDANLAANQLRVRDAASVSGWLAGEQLRLGDPNPTAENVQQMVAIDVSNYLSSAFGSSFRQRGLKLSFSPRGTGGRVSMGCSGTGAAGTTFGSSSNSDGSIQSSFVDVVTTVQSPISNSNLLFVSESLSGGTALAATRNLRVAGVWV